VYTLLIIRKWVRGPGENGSISLVETKTVSILQLLFLKKNGKLIVSFYRKIITVYAGHNVYHNNCTTVTTVVLMSMPKVGKIKGNPEINKASKMRLIYLTNYQYL
jgi:hypothetical protein